jgi:pyruvate kinase
LSYLFFVNKDATSLNKEQCLTQMGLNPNKLEKLQLAIDSILKDIKEAESQNQDGIAQVAPAYRKSARNLVHYHALRNHDLRGVQKKLRNLGISRLANAQGHLEASLLKIQYLLNCLQGKPSIARKSGLSIKDARALLNRHTKELLGYRSKNRRVRIMVTQPTIAASDYHLVLEMVRSGMNCARINCAHDNPEIWEKIIANVKKASNALDKKVRISMDLAGPKIRTGMIKPGAKVKKFSPKRDDMGRVINPAQIILKPELTEVGNPKALPVDPQWFKRLRPGDQINFVDTRDKSRTIWISHVEEDQAVALCEKTCYIATGTVFKPTRANLDQVNIGELPPVEPALLLCPGNILVLTREGIGEPAQVDSDGEITQPAHISCQLPEVFDDVKPGETVLFDDGKIGGLIEACAANHLIIRITRAKETGSKLRAEKGINFPNTDFRFSGLTDKDREDLIFVAKHADVVNFSFVNTREDVELLLAELEKIGAKDQLSIILKIETRKAFNNLTEILLTAMKTSYIGVMIARGDLAVETGWDNIGRVQKEILSICNAAHVPVVWATQVLENLAKKGLPSRSEITDAAISLKAECVMLNKGIYINAAIKLLDKILQDMENLYEKHESMLPRMERLSGDIITNKS